ncbi:MAG: GNAT family N-acetyltransferase [Acidobacteriia bacterium]|nr:GNAT family N-acetyltransferase [Terriglobia bacterium]
MEIRILTEHDAEAWWHLRRLALETDPRSFVESVADHERNSIEQTRERVRRGGAENFIVGMFEDGRLAGMAGFYRDQHAHLRHKGHIWGVYVRQESRGKGAAKKMIEEIIRRARQIPGVEQILLVVSATQAAARRVYESLGFRRYGTEPKSLKVSGEYIDDELMVLYL